VALVEVTFVQESFDRMTFVQETFDRMTFVQVTFDQLSFADIALSHATTDVDEHNTVITVPLDFDKVSILKKTFFVRILQISELSYSICPRQAFPA
jgi:hypothetical protein